MYMLHINRTKHRKSFFTVLTYLGQSSRSLTKCDTDTYFMLSTFYSLNDEPMNWKHYIPND